MKTIRIRTDASICNVPVSISFQGAPGETFEHAEKCMIQLVDSNDQSVGKPEVRSVVKTHDAKDEQTTWYEAYISSKI